MERELPWPRGLSAFMTGMSAGVQGLSAVFGQPKLRLEAAIPILLTGLLYVLAVVGLGLGSGPLLDLFWPRPDGAGWLLLWWVARSVLVVGATFVLILLFTAVVEAVAGPFLERSMVRLLKAGGVTPSPTSMWDSTGLELMRGLGFSLMAVVPLLFSWLPAVGIVFAGLAGLLAAYGLGSGPWSAVLVLLGVPFRHRMSWLWRHKLLVLGLGTVSTLGLLVPVLGLFVVPAAHVGATDGFLRVRKRAGPKAQSEVAATSDS